MEFATPLREVTTFRNRNQELEIFFLNYWFIAYYKDIDGLIDAMHIRNRPEQWRLLIGASKKVLKQSSYKTEIS